MLQDTLSTNYEEASQQRNSIGALDIAPLIILGEVASNQNGQLRDHSSSPVYRGTAADLTRSYIKFSSFYSTEGPAMGFTVEKPPDATLDLVRIAMANPETVGKARDYTLNLVFDPISYQDTHFEAKTHTQRGSTKWDFAKYHEGNRVEPSQIGIDYATKTDGENSSLYIAAQSFDAKHTDALVFSIAHMFRRFQRRGRHGGLDSKLYVELPTAGGEKTNKIASIAKDGSTQVLFKYQIDGENLIGKVVPPESGSYPFIPQYLRTKAGFPRNDTLAKKLLSTHSKG